MKPPILSVLILCCALVGLASGCVQMKTPECPCVDCPCVDGQCHDGCCVDGVCVPPPRQDAADTGDCDTGDTGDCDTGSLGVKEARTAEHVAESLTSNRDRKREGTAPCTRCKRVVCGADWHTVYTGNGMATFLCERCWAETSESEKLQYLHRYFDHHGYSANQRKPFISVVRGELGET